MSVDGWPRRFGQRARSMLSAEKRAFWSAELAHAAAFGCTGVGDWLVDSHWRWTDAHGWRRWSACGICLASNGLREPEGCTATDAITAAAEVRDG